MIGANTAVLGAELFAAIRTMTELGFPTIEIHPMGRPEATPNRFPGFEWDKLDASARRDLRQALRPFRTVTTHLPYTGLNYIDRDAAKRAFDAMLEDEQMAFLGLRGLIGQALRESDQAKALAYAERAFKLRPQTPWVVHSLFDMQAQVGQWKAAQETLDTGLRRKVVTQDKGRTLKALLLVERSREAEREGRASDALALAREAFGLAPERIAVTHQFARLQLAAGEPKKALKTVERGWALAPHPDLVTLYLEASGETEALKRVGVVRRLAGQNPTDIESHLALAQVSLDAGLWGEARRHLDAAAGTNPPVRVCRLMAEVEERAQSGQEKVHEWLARAADAPADRAWRCGACGAHHEAWRPVCESCGAFGTLQWRAPGTYGQILPPETRPAAALPTPATTTNTT